MKKIHTVTLIGLGAIGAAYGSRLQALLGNSFFVVANEDRIQKYQKNPITVNGEKQNFNYISTDVEAEPSDLVIFAVKNEQLPQAIEDAKYHIGPDTIILSLLNGISSEEEISEAIHNEHILYSMCVEIDAVRDDNQSIRFSSIGKICFGEKNQSLSEDVLAVKDLFERAEIPYEISENIWHTIWWKFMFNVGINQTSAVLRAPYRYFQQIPSLHQWMESAMYEVVAVAEKAGVILTEEDVKKFRPILNNLSPNGQTSMLQDIEAGRKTEVEYFAGKVCELGKKYRVATPINDQLYKMITIMEEMEKLNNR
ncbi:ketopantoate reductase family protein [Bacillus dakarensis]|uniref:ketopantoate reductase family protein n=1 Tax=Robertmurraya dakarensis TaxID=1926278 RepID=UPI0009812233|nr:ketopantoate reductase family protein [Bacillus dakarensis]